MNLKEMGCPEDIKAIFLGDNERFVLIYVGHDCNSDEDDHQNNHYVIYIYIYIYI